MKQNIRTLLTVGEIIPAKIIEKLDSNKYLVSLYDKEFLAYSPLDIRGDEILVEILEVYPKIHLKILPSNNPQIVDLIRISEKANISLNKKNSWFLLKLIDNDYNFHRNDIASDLKTLSDFSANYSDYSIIPIDQYLKIFAKDRDLFASLQETFVGSSFSELKKIELTQELIEDFVLNPENFIVRKKNYKKLNISLLKIKQIEKVRKTLEQLNSYLEDYSLDCYFLSNKGILSLIWVEIKENYDIMEYHFKIKLDTYEFSEITIKMNKGDIAFFVRNILESTINILKQFKPFLKRTLKNRNINLISFIISKDSQRSISKNLDGIDLLT